MLEAYSNLNGSQVRLLLSSDNVYFSAIDVNAALGFENPDRNRELARVVIYEKKSFLGVKEWGRERVTFIDKGYLAPLILKADQEAAESFIKDLLMLYYKVGSERYWDNDIMQINRGRTRYAITQVAKKFGMSAKELNKILEDHGVQFKVNGQWVLHYHYQDKGLTESVSFEKDDGSQVLHTYWTGKGLKFVEKFLQDNGYLSEGEGCVQLTLEL